MKLRQGTTRYSVIMRTLKVSAAMLACLALVGTTVRVEALSLTIGDSFELGTFEPGLPAGTGFEFDYLNALVSLAPGASTTVMENTTLNTIKRSNKDFGFLPTPTNLSQPSVANGQFTLPTEDAVYLAVHYGGGQNDGGWEVWYVGGHNGESVALPQSGFGGGLSGVTVFGVPDGGTTVLLLGGALSGLALLRRKLS